MILNLHLTYSIHRSSGSPPQQSQFLAIPPIISDRINEHIETRDTPRSVPRFDRPEPDTEKLLWIHVPYTHTGWVSQVIRRACHDRQEPNLYGKQSIEYFFLRLTLLYSLRKFINDENWYLNLNRARHLEPHARFVRPKCIHSRQMDASQPTKSEIAADPQLALYVSVPTILTRGSTNRKTDSLRRCGKPTHASSILTPHLASLGHVPKSSPTPQGSRRQT